jgi:hypothetical protein
MNQHTKKWLVVLSALVTLVAIGCGSDHTRPSFDQSSQGLTAELRITGANVANYKAVLMDLLDVEVWADGSPLPIERPHEAAIDLSRIEHAFLAARFTVPEGASALRFRARLDDFGGFESTAKAGAIDARSGLVAFESPVEWVSRLGHAVVQVDLERSLINAGEDRLLLPHFQVQY